MRICGIFDIWMLRAHILSCVHLHCGTAGIYLGHTTKSGIWPPRECFKFPQNSLPKSIFSKACAQYSEMPWDAPFMVGSSSDYLQIVLLLAIFFPECVAKGFRSALEVGFFFPPSVVRATAACSQATAILASPLCDAHQVWSGWRDGGQFPGKLNAVKF